jgi:enoyl-CoA hydratase/carnithine racemase
MEIQTAPRDLVLVADDGPVRIREALREVIADVAASTQVRALVLTGAGTAFCAGGDVKAMAARLETPPGQVAQQGWRRQHRTAGLTAELRNLPQITVAAVNGPAAGLGLDLALACDFIMAGPQASFAASFVKRGLIPDGGSLHYLPRRVGLQRAKELLLSARTVEADEAVRIGLADQAAREVDPVAEAIQYALGFAANSGVATSLTKSILNQSYELSLAQVAALGAQAQAICYTTDEHRAAVAEFVRPPASS